MAAQILPTPIFRGEDNNGKALAGGLLYTYGAGTTNPLATYTDSTGLTPNTNPIALNSRGEAQVWLALGQSYKLLLTDSSGNTIPGWPVDQVQGAGNFALALQSTLTNTSLPTQGAGYIGDNTALAYPPGTVGYEMNIRMPVFPSIDVLKTRLKTQQPTQVFVTGYYSAGDGGGGPYRLDATDTTSADNGVTIIVAADGGRWKLVLQTESVSLEQAGAKGDGTTDDTDALRNAIATGLNVGGRFGRTYRFTSAMTMSLAGQTLDLSGATLKPAGAFDAISLTASVITLRNLTIDGSSLNGFCVSAPAAIQQIVMEDVTLQNGTSGLQLIDCYTSWFTRLKVNFFSTAPVVIRSTIPGTVTNSMWFEECSFNGNTTAADVILLKGAVGIFIKNCNFQSNQSTACNEIRIITDASPGNGCASIVVEGCYFESFGAAGAAIYMGDPATGSVPCGSIKVIRNYFQTSKTPVKVGTFVANDLEVTGNTFQFVTGYTGFAIKVPALFVPNCHSNTGSLGDIDRSIIPDLHFGGANTGITYSSRSGYLTRVGINVYGEVFMQLTSVGSVTGTASIYGLSINGGGNVNYAHATIYNNMVGLPGPIFGGILTNTEIIQLYTNSATGNIVLTNANFSASTGLFMTFWYSV